MFFRDQHVDAIIFDLGGVILNIDYHLPVQAFKALGIDDFSNHFSQAAQSTLLDDYETGRISSEAFIEEVAKFVKPGTTEAQIRAAWNSILLDLPEERLFCLEKAAENNRIFLLSNTNEIHIEEFNRYLLNSHSIPSLEPFFEKLYLSYEIGLRKPERQIFEYVLADAGLNPETTLFIDDSFQHIQAAKALGIVSHHLLNEDICTLLDEN